MYQLIKNLCCLYQINADKVTSIPGRYWYDGREGVDGGGSGDGGEDVGDDVDDDVGDDVGEDGGGRNGRGGGMAMFVEVKVIK